MGGSTSGTDHNYLCRKRIKPHGIRVDESGRLLVPMFNTDGSELVNLQFVHEDGAKYYLKGGRARGCYFGIIGNRERIVLTEGFATAASIFEAVGCTVVVAFGAGNLNEIAKAVRHGLNVEDNAIWRVLRDDDSEHGLQAQHRQRFVDADLIIARR